MDFARASCFRLRGKFWGQVIMVAWVYLAIAGLLEIVWAVALKMSEGFTRPVPSVVVAVGAFGSFWFLAQAMAILPSGTAYAVWVGIGAAGVAIFGMVWFGEPATVTRFAGLGLVLAGIALLKIG